MLQIYRCMCRSSNTHSAGQPAYMCSNYNQCTCQWNSLSYNLLSSLPNPADRLMASSSNSHMLSGSPTLCGSHSVHVHVLMADAAHCPPVSRTWSADVLGSYLVGQSPPVQNARMSASFSSLPSSAPTRNYWHAVVPYRNYWPRFNYSTPLLNHLTAAFRPDTRKSESFFKSPDVGSVFTLLNLLSLRFVKAANETDSLNSLSISSMNNWASCLLASSFDFVALVVFMSTSFWRLCPSFRCMLGVAYFSEADCHYAVSAQQQSPYQNCKVWWNWTTLFYNSAIL